MPNEPDAQSTDPMRIGRACEAVPRGGVVSPTPESTDLEAGVVATDLTRGLTAEQVAQRVANGQVNYTDQASSRSL